MSRFDAMGLNAPHTQRHLDEIPQRGALTADDLRNIVSCGQDAIAQMQRDTAYTQTRIQLELATVMDAKRRLYALGFKGTV